MAGLFHHSLLSLWRRGALLVTALLCAQCSLWKTSEPAPQPDAAWRDEMRQGQRAMGEVTVVDKAGRFVWLRTPLANSVAPETPLVIRAQTTGEVTAKLLTSPERKRHYVAADVKEGSPKVGDAVFFANAQKPLSTTPPPLGPLPGAASTEGHYSPTPDTTPSPSSQLPFSLSDVPPPTESETSNLPPLGQPSGPVEDVPQFDPLPEPPEIPQ